MPGGGHTKERRIDMDRTYRKFKKSTAMLKAVQRTYIHFSDINKNEPDNFMAVLRMNAAAAMLFTEILCIRAQPGKREGESFIIPKI